jgi:hypothetical protein
MKPTKRRGGPQDAHEPPRSLLAELAQLEAKRREGSALPEKSERRRLRILNELEQIYSELDATVGRGEAARASPRDVSRGCRRFRSRCR